MLSRPGFFTPKSVPGSGAPVAAGSRSNVDEQLNSRVRELEGLVAELTKERDALRSELDAANAVIVASVEASSKTPSPMVRGAMALEGFATNATAWLGGLVGAARRDGETGGAAGEEGDEPAETVAAADVWARRTRRGSVPEDWGDDGEKSESDDEDAPAAAAPAAEEDGTGAEAAIISDEEVQKVFARFDQDGNGHIDEEELVDALSALNLNVTEHQAGLVLGMYDDDKNGTLEIEEFAKLVRHFLKFTTLSPETSDAELMRRRSVSVVGGGGGAAPAATYEDLGGSFSPRRVTEIVNAAGGPLDVKSLDDFLVHGKTGFEDVSDSLDADARAVIDFLQGIGVTKNTLSLAGKGGKKG